MLYKELRIRVCKLNQMLREENLVVWTGGNISAFVRESGHIIIKPSGVLFHDLKPESMVVIDIKGNIIDGDLKPSVDSSIHAYLYSHRSDINGICHTHSPYATSFAVLGKSIPAALTPLSHMTGRDIPCTRYAKPGYIDTGEAILEADKDGHGVLVQRHGIFTYGKDPETSLKYAIYIEEAARTIHYAMLRGQVTPLPNEEIKRCFDFYKKNYGQ